MGWTVSKNSVIH